MTDSSRIYREGYRDGYRDAREGYREPTPTEKRELREMELTTYIVDAPKRKRKRPASKKQKLLKTMTDKKWKTYKGKKTWIQIRAEVSRSQAYKKKARRL